MYNNNIYKNNNNIYILYIIKLTKIIKGYFNNYK